VLLLESFPKLPRKGTKHLTMVKLTVEFCLGATRQSDPLKINKLNLWGCDLDNVDCLQSFPNLRVLSMSINDMTTLSAMAKCHNLEELFIRNNKITDFRELRHLSRLPKLKILWLKDNPIHVNTERSLYRARVFSHCPHLVKIDEHDVTDEDRRAAEVLRRKQAPEQPEPTNQAVEIKTMANVNNLSQKSRNIVLGFSSLARTLDLQQLDNCLEELQLMRQELACASGAAGPI